MLSIQSLSKKINDKPVLKDVSFDVKAGEVLVVVGPSGAGKSTLLRALSFLSPPDEGRVSVGSFEMEATGVSEASCAVFSQQIGFVFQDYALFPHRRALDNVIEALVWVKGEERTKAVARGMALLTELGLEDFARAWPAQLSGGQKQRVAIARALALGAPVIVFDEPTSALDAESTADVLSIVKSIAADDVAVVIVTHDIPFAFEVADTMMVLEAGVVTEYGVPSELLSNAESFVNRKKM